MNMQQDFIIRQWSVWPERKVTGDGEGISQNDILAAVPKMLKRRFSPLAKIVYSAASLCLDDNKLIPTVFSSSHGELAKSFHMMEMIEAGEDISPTAFSLSVHNAIAGLFSMAYKNRLQTAVVAPGEEGVAPAFIEALGLLQEGAEEVLIVFYDEPVVEFYPIKPYLLSSDYSCAVALRIARQGAGMAMQMSNSAVIGDDGEQPLQLPRLIEFLAADNKADLMLKTPRQSWCWKKC